jgi:uncharacterized protein (DUF58 family)
VTPTTRCAWVLAGVALVGLLVAEWLAIAGALAVLAAMLADGLSVRTAPPLRRTLDELLSRGVAASLSVQALAPDARRVLLRQPATPALRVQVQADGRALDGEVVAVERGRQRLPGVASASVGPLGLARWHHRAGSHTEVLVYPDLVSARRLVLRLRQGRAAPGGRLRRGPLGLGTEFESIREYCPDDDIRQVNWRASARLGRPMSNQFRVEQDHDVVCVLDAGRLMGAALAQGTLLDATLDAATAVALVADELGDRCGAIAFDAEVRRVVGPRRAGGRRVLRALFDLQPTLEDSDFERAFMRVGGSRRALVLVFTDLIDERAARSLVEAAPMLTRRHTVVVAGISDPALETAAREARDQDHDEAARSLAALSVLRARDGAAARIRHAGADVVLATPAALPERCVQAYLRAKARARL